MYPKECSWRSGSCLQEHSLLPQKPRAKKSNNKIIIAVDDDILFLFCCSKRNLKLSCLAFNPPIFFCFSPKVLYFKITAWLSKAIVISVSLIPSQKWHTCRLYLSPLIHPNATCFPNNNNYYWLFAGITKRFHLCKFNWCGIEKWKCLPLEQVQTGED